MPIFPADANLLAVSITCSSDSALQGPAISNGPSCWMKVFRISLLADELDK
jgi:hypothetical protein